MNIIAYVFSVRNTRDIPKIVALFVQIIMIDSWFKS